MFSDGSFALALVRNQVMLVQGIHHLLTSIVPSVLTNFSLSSATRSYTKDEKYLHVHTYTPFGQGVFLASDVPDARIASKDLLRVLPPLENEDLLDQGMLELPQLAFSQYVELSSRHTKRHETLWKAWTSKN